MSVSPLDDELHDLRCELTKLRATVVNQQAEIKFLRRWKIQRRKRRLASMAHSGRIWGYARASTDDQVKSCETQEDLIRRKAARLPGQLMRVYVDEAISAYEIRWEERDGFRALMEVIGPGDHLIIWRLDRIERRPFAMLDAVRWLVEQGTSIHVLEQGEMQLDLDTSTGRIMLMFMAMMAGFFVDQLSEATRNGIKAAKQRGLAHGAVELGKRRLYRTLPDPKHPGKEIRQGYDVWDAEDCAIIREIWRRHELEGETFYRIGKDLIARKAARFNAIPWAFWKTAIRRGGVNSHCLNDQRLAQAFWRYTGLLARGRDFEDLAANPLHVERARERIERFAASARYCSDSMGASHQVVRDYRQWQAEGQAVELKPEAAYRVLA